MVDNVIIGKTGIVTGRIARAEIGEVRIEVRGGTEAYQALADADMMIERGTRVVVTEYFPPRTVFVAVQK